MGMTQRVARVPIESHAGFAIMRDRDSRPAVQDGFAHGGDGAGIINVRAEVRAVVDAAQDPFRVGHEMEQAEADAIGRRAVDGETIFAARLDPDAIVPGDGVADAGLRAGGRDNDGIAERAGGIC